MNNWEEALHKFSKAGERYAAAKALRIRLEKAEKSTRAQAFLEAKCRGNTVAEAEALARCQEQSLAAVEALVAAVEEEEGLRLRLEAFRTWFSMTQTSEATRRAEMNLAR